MSAAVVLHALQSLRTASNILKAASGKAGPVSIWGLSDMLDSKAMCISSPTPNKSDPFEIVWALTAARRVEWNYVLLPTPRARGLHFDCSGD